MRSLADHADAAYVSSRALTHAACVAVRPAHVWEGSDDSTPLAQAILRLNGAGAGISLARDIPPCVRQRDLSAALDAAKYRLLLEEADPFGQANLRTQEPADAAWIQALLCDGLDTHLSNRD